MSDDPIADLTKARERLVSSRRRMASRLASASYDELITRDVETARILVERQQQIAAVDDALKDEYNIRTSKKPANTALRGGAVRPVGDISHLE